jgi:hypothetical protein
VFLVVLIVVLKLLDLLAELVGEAGGRHAELDQGQEVLRLQPPVRGAAHRPVQRGDQLLRAQLGYDGAYACDVFTFHGYASSMMSMLL